MLVYRWYLARFQVAIIRKNHRDSARRAVTLAVATIDIVCENDTVFAIPLRVANLYRGFLLYGDGVDGSRRAYLRALVTLGAAVALLV